MLTRIRPAFALANWVSIHSRLFGDQIPRRSPGRSPMAKAFGKFVSQLSEFAIGQPDILVPDDDGRPLGIFLRDLVEMPTDRIADEKLVTRTMNIAGNIAGLLLHFRSSQTEDDVSNGGRMPFAALRENRSSYNSDSALGATHQSSGPGIGVFALHRIEPALAF